MLSAYEEVSSKIGTHESFDTILESFLEATEPEMQHRLAAVICPICDTAGIPVDTITKAKAILREKQSQGFASNQAEALTRAALDVSAGGA